MLVDGLLPYLDREAIMAAYAAAPGRETESGKFLSDESSAALVANAFGYFLGRPGELPLPAALAGYGTPREVRIEQSLRFPWAGGRHPWLDAVVDTGESLIAIESKRYEPFRPRKPADMSDAYNRPVWGAGMARFEAMRDALKAGGARFVHLDAVQLVKHGLGVLTQARALGKRPVLAYLHASPDLWRSGRPVAAQSRSAHLAEIERFAAAVLGDEVSFVALSWRDTIDAMAASAHEEVRRHGVAVADAFRPLWPGHGAV